MPIGNTALKIGQFTSVTSCFLRNSLISIDRDKKQERHKS
jgi:hypothetical protein